MMENRI